MIISWNKSAKILFINIILGIFDFPVNLKLIICINNFAAFYITRKN